jgi:hypothetical protein
LFRYLDGNEISPTCIRFSQCQGLYLICKELIRDGKLVWWKCIIKLGRMFHVKLITFWWICWPGYGLREWVSCSSYQLTSTTLPSRSKEFVFWFKSWNLFERGFFVFLSFLMLVCQIGLKERWTGFLVERFANILFNLWNAPTLA